MKLGDSLVRLGARMKSGFCQQRGIVLNVKNLTHEPSSLFHGFDRCGVGQLVNPEDMTKPSLEVGGGSGQALFKDRLQY